MKTPATLIIENALHNHLKRIGLFGVPEVGFDGDFLNWAGQYYKGRKVEKLGIVDYITLDTNCIVRCYEIKVTLADFHSKARATFIGQYNYYVVPTSLAAKIEPEVSRKIGIITVDNRSNVKFFRKPTRQELAAPIDKIKEAMFRAACREVSKRQTELVSNSISYGKAKLAKDGEWLGDVACWEKHPRLSELTEQVVEAQFLSGQCCNCTKKQRSNNKEFGKWRCTGNHVQALENCGRAFWNCDDWDDARQFARLEPAPEPT
jgi:hypothetical protein